MDIPKESKYEGYLWMSDADKPTVFNDIKPESQYLTIDAITNSSNPFMVEGHLYCKDNNKSYSIKYVDGEHIVVEYDLDHIPDTWVSDEKKDLKKFVVNRMDGVSKLRFRQYWKPENDELCEGMDVLVTAAFVFVGFEYNKIKEDK